MTRVRLSLGGAWSGMSTSSFGASKRNTWARALALRGEDHPTLFWPGSVAAPAARSLTLALPQKSMALLDLYLPHLQERTRPPHPGRSGFHLLPNTDGLGGTPSISCAQRYVGLCATLCHLLTLIPVIKLAILAWVLDRPRRRYATGNRLDPRIKLFVADMIFRPLQAVPCKIS